MKGRWKWTMYLNPALSLVEGVCTADTGLLAPLHLLNKQNSNERAEEVTLCLQLMLTNMRYNSCNLIFKKDMFLSCWFSHLALCVAAHRWKFPANCYTVYRPDTCVEEGLRPLHNYRQSFGGEVKPLSGGSAAECHGPSGGLLVCDTVGTNSWRQDQFISAPFKHIGNL